MENLFPWKFNLPKKNLTNMTSSPKISRKSKPSSSISTTKMIPLPSMSIPNLLIPVSETYQGSCLSIKGKFLKHILTFSLRMQVKRWVWKRIDPTEGKSLTLVFFPLSKMVEYHPTKISFWKCLRTGWWLTWDWQKVWKRRKKYFWSSCLKPRNFWTYFLKE